MDGQEFRVKGREMVDYIVNYLDSIGERPVLPAVEPGYLKPLLPDHAPMKGENWDDIMNDFEEYIMRGITHWQHPHFHAYFPSGNAYPSILADMIGDAMSCIGFSWAASPAYTELETIMMDWLGKMIGLPDTFLTFKDKSKGGGVIQGSASDCVLVNMLAARHCAIKALKQKFPDKESTELLGKLTAYCSKDAHSCVEKAAVICFVKLHILDADDKCSLLGKTVKEALEEDIKNGLVPFFVSLTLGTTSCCSFDALDEIGPICKDYEALWLHVDAAYAGNSFICPEFRYLMKGIEYATSFNVNTNKWLLINFDCSAMWCTDREKLVQAFVIDPLYLRHKFSESCIDYRHWGIPLSRRFRSLKMWFVFRRYGVEGLQEYVRNHIRLAKVFESKVREDDRFEVKNEVILALVCFRLKGSNDLNHKLLTSINATGRLHMVPAKMNKVYVIRFCVCAEHAKEEDIDYAWNEIAMLATELLERTGSSSSNNRGSSSSNN